MITNRKVYIGGTPYIIILTVMIKSDERRKNKMKNGLIKKIGTAVIAGGMALGSVFGAYAQSNGPTQAQVSALERGAHPIGNGYLGYAGTGAELREATALLGGELDIKKTTEGYNVSGHMSEIGPDGTIDGFNKVYKLVEKYADRNQDKVVTLQEATSALDKIIATEYASRNRNRIQWAH